MKNVNLWIALMALGAFAFVGCSPEGTAMEGDTTLQDGAPMGGEPAPTTDLDPNTGAAPGAAPEMGY